MLNSTRLSPWAWLAMTLVVAWVAVAIVLSVPHASRADEPAGEDAPGPTATTPADDAQADEDDQAAASDARGISLLPAEGKLSLLELIGGGGILMVPIALMALLVGTFGIERAIALRKSRVMPRELVDALGKMTKEQRVFDPRKAYRVCMQYPSTAARVVQSVLDQTGRSLADLEQWSKDTKESEALKLYRNVRWLSLAAAITPLMGLFGTVWGMILAFFQTAHLPVGVNKADALAEGIYVALVTTLGGLFVAIPAAFLAHLFEGRIQYLFDEIDGLLTNIMKPLRRFEGRVYVDFQAEAAGEAPPAPPVEAQAVAGDAQRPKQPAPAGAPK